MICPCSEDFEWAKFHKLRKLYSEDGLKCLEKGMLELDFSEVKAAKYSMNFLTRNCYKTVQNQGGQLTTSKVYQKESRYS